MNVQNRYNNYKNINLRTSVIRNNQLMKLSFVNKTNWYTNTHFKGKAPNNIRAIISLFDNIIKTKNHSIIVDNTLLKLISFNKIKAQEAIPYLESMLNRDLFNPFIRTKKKIFKAFLRINPENEKFLASMKKISTNLIESNLFCEEIEELLKIKNFKNDKSRAIVEELKNRHKVNKNTSLNVSSFILDRINISRTITNIDSNTKDIAYKNYLIALTFFKSNYEIKAKPDIDDLLILHQIITNSIPFKNRFEHQGIIRGSLTDNYKGINFSKNFIPTEKVPKEMQKFETWYNNNYYKCNPFALVAEIDKKLMKIHPFYDGNGRTIRLFLDWVLAGKGYLMKEYPEKYSLPMNTPLKELKEIVEKSCVSIKELKVENK